MVFTSPLFLFAFLPLTLLGSAMPVGRARTAFLLLASWFFYAWWRPIALLLLIATSAVALIAARTIAASREAHPVRASAAAIVGVVAPLALLAFFKYSALAVETLNGVLHLAAAPRLPVPTVALPIGISFYTFQIVSFVVDVATGDSDPPDDPLELLAYVALFPQLIAGPIVRYREIAGQFRAPVRSRVAADRGAQRFMRGFALKALVADALDPLVVALFDGTTAVGAAAAWLGLLAYAMQIYLDFTAYSDMAIGLGALLGFTFPENFDTPYRSRSVTEFWRRWHMTLSRWLRDYLYIPLGGSRRGAVRTYVNLIVVMVLGGLWHGAAWTFVAWGAWHGAFLAIERAFGRGARARGAARAGVRAGAARLYALGVVFAGWILFRAPNVASAARVVSSLAGVGSPESPVATGPAVAVFAAVLIVISEGRLPRRLVAVAVPVAFVIAIVRTIVASYSPFLYFQF